SPLWPASQREKRPPRSQSGPAVSARRVPRGENSGAGCVLSKEHERKFSGNTRQLVGSVPRGYSAFSQPTFGAVLLFSDFSRPVQNFFIDLSLSTIRGQLSCKSLREIGLEIDTLNAALLEQSAAGPALGCASDFAAIDHHVRTHRVCKTAVSGIADAGPSSHRRAAWVGVNDPGYNGALPYFTQRIAQSLVNFFINRCR